MGTFSIEWILYEVLSTRLRIQKLEFHEKELRPTQDTTYRFGFSLASSELCLPGYFPAGDPSIANDQCNTLYFVRARARLKLEMKM